MAWDVVSKNVGSLLTAANINQLQDNFPALADQNSGAPLVVFPNSGTYGAHTFSLSTVHAESGFAGPQVSSLAKVHAESGFLGPQVSSFGLIHVSSTVVLAADPTQALEAATKQYADAAVAGWVLLASASPSNVAVVDFLTGIDATYRTYVLLLIKLKPVAQGRLELLVSDDGGTTFESVNYRYAVTARRDVGTDGPTQSTNAAFFQLNGADDVDEAASLAYNGTIYIFDPAAGVQPAFRWDATYGQVTGQAMVAAGGGRCEATAAAINALRVRFNATNIDDGELRLYGIRSS